MAKEEIKKLTQAQRGYLVKRINEIANAKIAKLGGTTNYGVQSHQYYYSNCSCGPHFNTHSTDIGTLRAIVKGDVKLQSKSDIMADLKSVIKDNGKTHFSLGALAFVNLESLEKFNADRNKKIKDEYKAKQARIASVRKEADGLKDKVMLDGSLAGKLLDKFEKKEF